MTERKPSGMTFSSWIDQQIQEAEDRGAFENLPGAGRPLPNRGEADDGLAWLRDKLKKEGVSADELLPTPLKLRKQRQRLAESVPELRSEQDVRDAVAELNQRIMEWRRIPLGPPIFVPLVNEEDMLERWRDARPAPPPPADPSRQPGAGEQPRPRWWRRRR
ncbi:MAG TPA: DUF1992 domain-containing protein [Streptosporangiaceae bacterium]